MFAALDPYKLWLILGGLGGCVIFGKPGSQYFALIPMGRFQDLSAGDMVETTSYSGGSRDEACERSEEKVIIILK